MNEQLVFQLCISVLIPIYSGLPGLWIAQIMRKTNSSFFYSVKNFEMTKNIGFYKRLRLDLFTYFVKNTFFRHCNTKIKITKKPSINEADQLLNEITISELCHLFGFIFVLIFQIGTLILDLYTMFFCSLLFNTIFNIYPIFLQECNKLRLRNFLKILQQ
ncbi:hypothetical protein CLU83_0416 [Flavobacterium sp. 1]|uniref:glycosyl-4,4'-diaponeurosporenoate acyltransferase CrtO family protein n=1 Tax=Flavobacterium sp. 1 TaxID=2035200 RepID=UPI000CB9778A|nr:hypothetical protein CLU83_0416 [Flavobacterium sp. 1]